MLFWLWGCTGSSMGPTESAMGPPETPDTLRVATWNVEGLGKPDSAEYQAAREVLVRIDADIIGLNEIREGEEDALSALALDLGYDEIVQPRTNPFGSTHNAMLSRLPIGVGAFPSSAVLSGDSSANDVTRWPVAITVTAPWGDVVGLAVQHCKSGFNLDDAFRRSVDAHRLGQATKRLEADHYVAMGDLNEDRSELQASPPSPARWTFPPGGLPSGFELGDDIEAILDSEGLANHPFQLLGGFGLNVADAKQPDGREMSRDSGRLIDYVLHDSDLRPVASEIYDSRDEGFPSDLDKPGEPLGRDVSRTASDHLPVLVEFGAM